MSALGVSFKMLARQVKDDKISAVMIGFPIVVALLLYFFAPMVSDGLVARYGAGWDLHRLFPMFDAIVAAFAIITPGYAAVMVILGEIDERVTPSLCASPLGRGGYLFSRLGLPTLFSVAVAFVLCFTLNLAGLPAPMYVTVILVTLVADTLPSMIVVAFARNKVEGVALFKIAIFATFVIIVPFFVDSWVQWLFAPLPSFWIGKLVKELNYLYAIPALLTSLVWLVPLWRRFMKKI